MRSFESAAPGCARSPSPEIAFRMFSFLIFCLNRKWIFDLMHVLFFFSYQRYFYYQFLLPISTTNYYQLLILLVLRPS
jgi:presenilin-like A22 family membrane protease